VCLQPPCASSWTRERPKIVSRDRQLRSARVLRVGVAGLDQLAGSAAEELKDSMLVMWFTRVNGPLDVDLQLVLPTFNACFNVELWSSPAYSGRIYTHAA
jgi:hypothetical protein